VRRRTSARFFPKKGCSIRLDVGEWAVALNICEALGSLKANLFSKKPRGKTPSGFVFQAAFAMLKGSLKRLRYGNTKSGYGGDTPCSASNCANGKAA